MKCGYCGKPLKENAKFCTNCGQNVSEIASDNNKITNNSKGATFLAVVTLIFVIAIICGGCFGIISRSIRDWNTISPSKSVVSPSEAKDDDNNTTSSDEDTTSKPDFVGDASLMGKWQCRDKTAAGFNEQTDYGILTSITLTFNKDGTFGLDYEMENTGIQVRDIHLEGTYTVNSGKFTLCPNLSTYEGDYFHTHGDKLSVEYKTSGKTLVITTADKLQFTFTAV